LSQVNQVSQTGWQIFVEVLGKAPIELPAGESVIGRSRSCTVQIAETTVSRQHAIFVVEPGKVRLRDLGSSNGTFVNGGRVDGEIPLADGDRVVVGETEIVLRMLAPLGPSEATAKLVIPPLAAPLSTPAPAPTPPRPPAPPAAAPRMGPAPGSQAPWSPTPLSRIPAAPAPLPPAALAPSALVVPIAPIAPIAPFPADAAPAGGELLSSIRDIDLAPVPPPVPRPSPVATPVAKAATTGKVEPAGFWLRVAASLLDSIPFGILAGAQVGVALFISPFFGKLIFATLVAYGLVVMLVLPALWGTTPGKKLMKLAIVSETTGPGEGLGWKTAALRLVGYLVCSVTFGLGYLLVAFSAHKQGLHDLIAKTNVVRKR
jgi:pSer/pThr/pTyr-binding forkhead associated (FHA) protein/uncharacterized RDD family membrane protein YckC